MTFPDRGHGICFSKKRVMVVWFRPKAMAYAKVYDDDRVILV